MSAPIDVLLSRLDGVRQSKANNWMARCPAHNGDGRSLSVTYASDGRILIYCFAHECDVSEVLGAVDMSVSDLFPDRLPEHRYAPMRHAVPAIDVLRVMRHELTTVAILMEDFEAGRLTLSALDRGLVAAGRIRKALDLCDG